MKKVTAILSMLATVLLNALPAFSASTTTSGAYGPYMPFGGAYGVEQRVESHQAAVSGGFYGSYVPFGGAYGVKGGDESGRTALSGSYGAYGPYLPKGVTETTRDNCLIVARNCPKNIYR